MKIAITTPTGHIGHRLTEILLERGADLVLLARNPEKVRDFAQKGATVRQGTLDDQKFVVEATKGTDALFWLTPADYQSQDLRAFQNRLGKAAGLAVRENKIPRVVNLSSVGAQHGSGTGPVDGLYDVEKILDEAAENVTHLRPAYFFENYFMALEAIRAGGQVFMPVSGEVPMSMIGTRDVAQVAADQLLDTTWSGRNVIELEGSSRLSFAEAAEQIGKGIGRPVQHVEVGEDQTRPFLKQAGLSDSVAELMLGLYRGIGSGRVAFEKEGTTHLDTPTSLGEFAREVLKPALSASN